MRGKNMDLFRCVFVFGLLQNGAFPDYYHQSKRIEGNIHRSYTTGVITKVVHSE
jgi:hypothetical protein